MKRSHFSILGLLTIFLAIGLIVGCGGANNDQYYNPNDYNTLNVSADGYSSSSTTKLTLSFHQSVTGLSENDITLSGVSGVVKGTLRSDNFYFSQYILPISGFKESGTLNVKVVISGKEYSSSVRIYYSSPADGIYLGIIKFAGNAESIEYDINDSNIDMPVLLNSNVKDGFKNRLNYGYEIAREAGTVVYYAVHKALANLKISENKLPENPDSVYIITFTDGLDNQSTGLSVISPIENKSFTTTADYITYVKDQITNRKINGKGITAYSIGVKGSDVTDSAGFTTSLQNIASPGKSKELTNFSDVSSTFNEIADGLIQGSNLTLTTTLLESNTKVRMTFDSRTLSDAGTSIKYIEGTIIAVGNNYTFTNIKYAGGISSDAGPGPITGNIISTTSGPIVKFLFRNITGYNYITDRANTKQWLMRPGTSTWQVNSEYASDKADFGNTIIYLVLDCSTSMNASNISYIRETVKDFIDKIYNARYGN